MKNIKNYLITGLLVWLPISLTIWIIKILLESLDKIIPDQVAKMLFGVNIPGIGLIFVIIILLITGIIAKNVFGRSLLLFSNKIILKIPVVKSLYKGIRQVSYTLLSSNGNAFRKALLVQFPHQNSWTIGFITGNTSHDAITDGQHDEYLNVYVPTTPNPTSGYFIIVKKSDTKKINMTVEEALRYVISMGTVDPKTQIEENI
jgi:uncharacterized membrane protein